jgi:hypothetical protein
LKLPHEPLDLILQKYNCREWKPIKLKCHFQFLLLHQSDSNSSANISNSIPLYTPWVLGVAAFAIDWKVKVTNDRNIFVVCLTLFFLLLLPILAFGHIPATGELPVKKTI